MNYCEMCFRNATEIGEIYPHHFLIKDADGFYKIVNAHDEIVRFQTPPILDPCDGMSDEEINEAWDGGLNKEFLKYSHYAENFRRDSFRFHPQHGHQMVEFCKQVGYDPDKTGWLDHWLIDRAARMIRDKKT